MPSKQADPSFVAVESIADNDSKATYRYDGPMGGFQAVPDAPLVPRGGEVVLSGRQVRHAIAYGSRFKTKDGKPIRTERQIAEAASVAESAAPVVPTPDPPLT